MAATGGLLLEYIGHVLRRIVAELWSLTRPNDMNSDWVSVILVPFIRDLVNSVPQKKLNQLVHSNKEQA